MGARGNTKQVFADFCDRSKVVVCAAGTDAESEDVEFVAI